MRLTRRQLCAAPFHAYASTLLGSLLGGTGCGVAQKAVEPDILSSLGFGSCNKQDMLTKHWPIINDKKAQGWLWMGDAIYADGLMPRPRADEYAKVLSDAGYQQLLKQSFVMGTWDDHDYAANDSGIEYEEKVGSQEIFLNFIDEPLDSARRTQQGVYWSKIVGTEANAIQFLLLDLRYFKQKAGSTNADPIGEAQWAWLEGELQRPGPQLRVLVSSIQALTDFSGRDSWACYPTAQARLMSLLGTSSVPVVILSGDRHLQEISKRQLSQDRTIYEITSSGLTHFSEMQNTNAFRVGDVINETNFGVLNFNWDTSGKASIRSLSSTLYSPQSGGILREFAIPLTWI